MMMMNSPHALSRPLAFSLNKLPFPRSHPHSHSQSHSVRVNTARCSNSNRQSAVRSSEYEPGIFDALLLDMLRRKIAEEVGWDSEKPGYSGLIEVAGRLMMKGGRSSNAETVEATVRVIKSLFPPLLLTLYQMLIAPIQDGKVAAEMVATVTALSCKWLMGPCIVNSVDLADGSTCNSGVFVERCKYLEESKCAAICINTCKLPAQLETHCRKFII